MNSWPNERVPDFPRVAISLKEDWISFATHGALVAWASPEVDDGFRPNVVVTASRRQAKDANWDIDVEAATRTVSGLPEAQMDPVETDDKGRHRAFLSCSYEHPKGGRLEQVITLVEVVAGQTSDLVQVTASWRSGTEMGWLVEAVKSVKFGFQEADPDIKLLDV